MTAENNEMSEIEKLRQQLAETRVQLEAAKRLLDQLPPDVFFGEQAPATTSELKEARQLLQDILNNAPQSKPERGAANYPQADSYWFAGTLIAAYFAKHPISQSVSAGELVAEARAIKLAAAAVVGLATRHMDTASYSVPEIQLERLVQLLYPPPLRAPADGGDGYNQ